MSGYVELSMLFPEGAEEAIKAQLSKDPRFQPYRVGSRAPHSVAVEFGTYGFSGDSSSSKSNGPTPVEEDIRKWVKDKLQITDEKKLRAMAHNMYRKIMEEGIAPNPFLRPAVHNVLFRLSSADDAWQGQPQCMETIGQMIEDEMRRIIVENKIIFTGELMSQLYHIPLAEAAAGGDVFLDTISDDVWQSNTKDYKGDESRWQKMQQRGFRHPLESQDH